MDDWDVARSMGNGNTYVVVFMEGEFDTMSSAGWLCDVMKTSMISALSLFVPARHLIASVYISGLPR